MFHSPCGRNDKKRGVFVQTLVRNTSNKLLIKWDAELLNLDDILYYYSLIFINALHKPSNVHIRPFMLLSKPKLMTGI